ncbi:MAG: DUF433 domain-containing protein [Candidatus Zixiibacteriota bacterium]|nr:MAG: DUF433 domain-containing protein [candidate division Zixibacteria bacterium]
MNERLEIRKTGVSILDVLDLLGRGCDYNLILRQYPALTSADIARAARMAHDLILGRLMVDLLLKCPWRGLEQTAPAGTVSGTWKEGEISELVRLHRYGASVSLIARLLRRTTPEIRAALNERRRT